MFKASIATDPIPDSGLDEAALGGGLAGAAVGAVGLGGAAASAAIGGIPGGVPGMVVGAVAGLILGSASGALLGGGLQHVLQLSLKSDRMRSDRSVRRRACTGSHTRAAELDPNTNCLVCQRAVERTGAVAGACTGDTDHGFGGGRSAAPEAERVILSGLIEAEIRRMVRDAGAEEASRATRWVRDAADSAH
jgi:hypothetical protein